MESNHLNKPVYRPKRKKKTQKPTVKVTINTRNSKGTNIVSGLNAPIKRYRLAWSSRHGSVVNKSNWHP